MPNEIRNGTHRVYGDTVAASLRFRKACSECLSGGRWLTIAAPKTTVEVSNYYHSCCSFRFSGLIALSEVVSLRHVIRHVIESIHFWRFMAAKVQLGSILIEITAAE